MKSFSFAKALTLGCLVCLTLPVACGDDDSGTTTKPGTGGEPNAGAPSTGDAGAGGMAATISLPGTSTEMMTIKCGADMCTSVKTLIPGPVYVDPCCAGTSCGVNVQFFGAFGSPFKDSCQAVAQVGEVDEACPASADQTITVPGSPAFAVPGFAGCCRADTGTCGVVIDSIPITGLPVPFAAPMLGCTDSAPFFANKPGAACGAGVGGNGAGGASGVIGGSDAGGNGAATGGAGGNPL